MSDKKVQSKKNFKDFLNAYVFEYKLPGSGKVVKFKPLITHTMKMLAEYENENSLLKASEGLDKLITECVIEDNFDINDLYINDRFSLLIEIRKRTKGDKYQFPFTCPECQSQSLQTINLSNLTTKDKVNDSGDVEITPEIKLIVKHLKRKDEKEAEQRLTINENGTVNEIDYTISMLAACIESIETPAGIDTDLSFEDKKLIIESTPQTTIERISEWFENNKFGVDFSYKIKCKQCQYEKNINIPINQLFF